MELNELLNEAEFRKCRGPEKVLLMNSWLRFLIFVKSIGL